MPPKKGKGKGKGGKGKEKKVKVEPEPKLEHVDENTKQFFLLQIRDLEEKIKRYQRKCDELEIMCKKYESLYETSNTDKRDIVSNLKKELEKKMDEILDLNDRLVGLQQAKDAEKEAFDKQLTDLRTEFQETKDVLTNQNNSLLAKLTALEEFKSQKEELLSKLEMLEKQVEFLENDHKSRINDIEKKVIIDKDRLKKDMIVKVSQVAAEFRRVSNKQMADTTKRTIKENVSINSQLQKMSKKVTELIEDNSKEKEKMQVHKQQINLLEENEKELAKKNVSNLKVLRMLTDKCHSQEAMIVELEEKFNELSELNAFKDEDLRALKSELEQLSQAKTDSEAFTERIKVLEKELDENRRTRVKIENILKKAIDAIVISLSKRAVAKSMAESSETSELEELEKRDSMLESLLILLNSGASLGFGPNPSTFGSSEYSNHRPFTSEFPGKKVSKELEDILLPRHQTNTFHYQLGDLGLIPKKNEHIMTNIEKMKLHHPQKELGTLRKLTKKSVATQTIDFQKASIFGVESPDERSTGIHPIFDANSQQSTTKRAAVKSNILNANNRVTDKVF